MEDLFFSKSRTIRETAEYMQSTEAWVRSEITRGHLHVRKFGKKFVRILPEDLRAWVDHATKQTSEKQEEALV
jgi:hypothetical protein